MSNWLGFVMVAVIFVPTSVLLTLVPYLIRKTESFGVSVTEDVHALPINRSLRKQYALITGIICALLTASVATLHVIIDEQAWAVAMTLHIAAIVAGSFLVYLKFHFMTKKLKREHNWSSVAVASATVVDTGFFRRKLAYSAWWFAPQIALALLTFVTGILQYDRFPDQLIMQYDLQGNPTSIIEKTHLTVLWPAVIQCFLISVFALCYYIILRSKQQIDAADPEGSLKRNIIFRRRWSAFVLVLGFLITGLFYFMQLSMLYEFSPAFMLGVSLGVVGIILVASLVLSVTTGQGGSRLAHGGDSAPGGKANTDHDQYWKLGIFYFNRHDPAMFVEKRFGIGWTVNFARPIGWILLAAVVAIPFALGLLLK